ncbi:MAG: SH3 domain-containing protein, partial [Chloroflexota bacterium]
MKRVPIYLIVILLFCLNAACAAVGGEVEPAVEEQEVIVETVVVVATPTPDPEPEPEEEAPEDLPDLDVPQAQPGEPTVTANVDLNVRRGPGTIYSVVGALRAGNSARILGSNPARTWWKIECPGGSGECWVSGGHQFSTAENAEGVLVAAVPPPPAQPAATSVAEADTYTPTATADPAATPTATYPPATATYIASQATATPTATATGQATATATATT